MESSRRDLSIAIVVQKCIFKNNLITLLSGFTFIPTNQVQNYPKQELFFTVNSNSKVFNISN